jgi:hypothetical protein
MIGRSAVREIVRVADAAIRDNDVIAEGQT